MFVNSHDIDDIVEKLSPDKVNILLVAEQTGLDIHQLIHEANLEGLTIAGGIFPMVLHEDSYHEQGVIVKYIDSAHKPAMVRDVQSEDLYDYFPSASAETHTCILLMDGLMPNTSVLLDQLYETYWNQINYVGAGAGSFSLTQSPCVFSNEGFFMNAAVVILSDKKSTIGVKHGWEKLAGPFLANKTEDNKILELNWRPAFEVYREVVEKAGDISFDKWDFFSVAQGYPFGIYCEGQEDTIRDPLRLNKDGSITCIGPVSQNVSLNIMHSNKSKMSGCADIAAKNALQDVMPSDIFVVDCISRALHLEEEFQNELSAIKTALNDKNLNLPVEGVLSLGEISTGKGGLLELYNKTIVVSTFL